MAILKLGKDLSSDAYWTQQNEAYAGRIATAYHAHRLAMVRDLIGPFEDRGATVVDFGCGDGVMLLDFPGAERIGIEPDGGLLDLARGKVAGARLVQGAVPALADLAAGSVDLLLCLNVAAYFTDEEDARFYKLAHRALKDGGRLVITHSNELFDLFTFNAFTVEFFRAHFGTDPTSLLRHPDKPQRVSYNVRENPLAYGAKLARYGFAQGRQGFSNHHAAPPLLDDVNPDAKQYRDTLAVGPDERWKLMFTCSTFGASATALADGKAGRS